MSPRSLGVSRVSGVSGRRSGQRGGVGGHQGSPEVRPGQRGVSGQWAGTGVNIGRRDQEVRIPH